jgi:hypothetical protein
MSDKVIGDYTAATTIDGTTHFLLIQPGNTSTAYRSINRNVFLGVTGQPVDISTSQTLTNKVIDGTNSITGNVSTFKLSGTNNRFISFALGTTNGTTRTVTFPDSDITLVGSANTQTLTNKTLTNPVISGGSIDNTTITVDAIAGHTAANTGTIYGLSITSAKMSGASITNATIGSTALAANAVQANQLATNAITIGYAQITTSFTVVGSGADQAVTGLTIAVTIPAGGRKVKITAFSKGIATSTAGQNVTLTIWDGTVGSGTELSQANAVSTSSNNSYSVTCIAIVTPAAGSKTYNVGIIGGAGPTLTVNAATTSPAFILVEAI